MRGREDGRWHTHGTMRPERTEHDRSDVEAIYYSVVSLMAAVMTAGFSDEWPEGAERALPNDQAKLTVGTGCTVALSVACRA